MMPKDPVILLSFINTRLRDCCGSLEDLCADLDADAAELTETLAGLGCRYDPDHNQFVAY